MSKPQNQKDEVFPHSQVFHLSRDRIKHPLWVRGWYFVRLPIEEYVGEQLLEQIKSQIWEQPKMTKNRESVSYLVYDQIKSKIPDLIDYRIKEDIFDQVGDILWDVVEEQARTQGWNQVWEQIYEDRYL